MIGNTEILEKHLQLVSIVKDLTLIIKEQQKVLAVLVKQNGYPDMLDVLNEILNK